MTDKNNKSQNYTIRLDSDEKSEWQEYAKEHFNNNMARMIRVAINNLMNPTAHIDASVDMQQVNRTVAVALEKNDTLSRVEKKLDIIAEKLVGFDPKALEMLDVLTDAYQETKPEQTNKRRSAHDF